MKTNVVKGLTSPCHRADVLIYIDRLVCSSCKRVILFRKTEMPDFKIGDDTRCSQELMGLRCELSVVIHSHHFTAVHPFSEKENKKISITWREEIE